MNLNPKVQFIGYINCEYIYLIDMIEVNIKEDLSGKDILHRLHFVNESLKRKVDFREDNIPIPLRDFLLFGYLFFRDELSTYLVYYIEKLILNCDKKKLTEMLILRDVFNVKSQGAKKSIYSSLDKSKQKYNDKIRQFICEQIKEGKKSLIGKLLKNNDVDTISRIIKLITLNSFLQICSSEFINEAIDYYEFIIKDILVLNNLQLSLNGVIASATGLSHKLAKDTKNVFQSREKEKLYKEIKALINKYNVGFYLLSEEAKHINMIEEALNNYTKLNADELLKFRPSRLLQISMTLYQEKFTLYLQNISRNLVNRNIIINRTNIIMEMFNNIDEVKANHIYTYYKMNSKNTVLEDYIIDKFKEQVEKQDTYNIDMKEDIWILYWSIKESLKKVTINFMGLNSSSIKNDIKRYYKFIIKKDYENKSETDGLSGILTSTNMVMESIKYLQITFKINSARDIKLIHVHRLVKYLQNDYRTKGNKRITISTIVSCINNLKGFIDWLIEDSNVEKLRFQYNPFQYVTFKGVYNKNTDIIPDCVIDKILFHLNDLREDIQRMVLIMLNCGLRFKEVSYLEEDCISESDSEYKILKYIPYKTLEARRRKGLDDYHRIVIDNELYKEIKKQLEYSKDIRKKYNAQEIFLTIGINDNLSIISNGIFCHAVQKIINIHNIKDEQGHLWQISSKQYRKTLAVDMITKGGANEREVANYLGHLNTDTTKRYYAEIRKKKLADMNSDFFKKKFELMVEEKHLQNFSEEERKSIYVDFCLNTRDVEYGVCIKAFNNIGNCKRRGDIFACATCSKICTGKKYHRRWEGLYENQKKRMDFIVRNYESNNISLDEYKKFREFEKEKYLLDSFKVVIDKLRGEYGDVK